MSKVTGVSQVTGTNWPGAGVKVQGHGRKSTKVRVNGQACKSIGVKTEEQCHKGNGTEIKGTVTLAKSRT